MFPILFQYGFITIYSFGVLMAAGFYFGSMVSVKEYERRGGDGEALWNLLVWVFLLGLASSRVLSIFNNPGDFLRAPITEIFAGAGFVWYGGFLGGALAAWILGRRRGMGFLTLADCCAPGLLLGQAFGRLGCHIAGDGDWGTVTTLPWGVSYSRGIAAWEHPPGVLVHPTPLYEAAAYTLVFAILWRWRKSNPPLGSLFAAYLVGNGFFRFLVEFIRVEPRFAFGLSEAQYIGAGMVVVGTIWLLRLRGGEPAPRAGRVLAALLFAVGLLTAGGCEKAAPPRPGDVAPEFVLPSITGPTRKLSNYRGKVVLVNLWATWCPPCIAELPVLDRLQAEYGEQGLVVLGVAGDEDPSAVKDFLAKSPVKFEVLLDPDGAIGTQYGITGYPETFFVDRTGRLQDKVIGALPHSGNTPGGELTKMVERLLRG